MNRRISNVLVFVLVALVAAAPIQSFASVNSGVQPVTLSYSQGETLSLTATPATITFNSAGVASGPISLTSTWNLYNQYTMQLDVYFTTSIALSSGSNNIPTSDVQYTSACSSTYAINCNNATGQCNLSGPPAGSNPNDPPGLSNNCGNIFQSAPTFTGQGTNTSTETLALLGTPYVATGTAYTGTLNFDLVAY